MSRARELSARAAVFACIGVGIAACTTSTPTTTAPDDASVPVVDAALPACSTCDAGGSVDASRPDASRPDASVPDASVPDSSVPDAWVPDSSVPDSSVPDAAPVDAALDSLDSSVPDDGPDAGVTTDDASFPGPGCADGTREGLDSTKYPDVATCTGFWTGDVVGAAYICAPGWHVCTGAEPAINAVAYADATAFPGCFAIDAAQDNYVCHPSCDQAVASGVDTAANVDMGAVGNDCKYKFPGTGSCITGGRIDTTENDGYGCNWNPTLTGVTCCRTGSD